MEEDRVPLSVSNDDAEKKGIKRLYVLPLIKTPPSPKQLPQNEVLHTDQKPERLDPHILQTPIFTVIPASQWQGTHTHRSVIPTGWWQGSHTHRSIIPAGS